MFIKHLAGNVVIPGKKRTTTNLTGKLKFVVVLFFINFIDTIMGVIVLSSAESNEQMDSIDCVLISTISGVEKD